MLSSTSEWDVLFVFEVFLAYCERYGDGSSAEVGRIGDIRLRAYTKTDVL